MYTLYSFLVIITSMKNVFVLLSDGFEEIESIIPIDLLRRAEITVTTISINESRTVTGAHGITVIADKLSTELDITTLPDAVFCPGGWNGSINLSKSNFVTTILLEMKKNNKIISAICAAPIIVLSPLGLLDGKKFTCYPGLLDCELKGENADLLGHCNEPVVQDENIITSQGPGSASAIAFKLIEVLKNKEISTEMKATALF